MEAGQKIISENKEFTLEDRLPGGSVGTVWSARRGDRLIAAKFFTPPEGSYSKLLPQFIQEAEKLGKLDHRNIVKVYDFKAGGAGDIQLPYFTMELLEKSLEQMSLEDLKLRGRLEVIFAMCAGLNYAYANGIEVHADIHPGNVLTDRWGEFKIADFGMMPLEAEDIIGMEATILTQKECIDETRIQGKTNILSQFASYEVRTQGRKAATKLSDIYSMGEVLRYLLPKNMTPEIERLLGVYVKATSNIPEGRYKTISDFNQAVSDALEGKEEKTEENKEPAEPIKLTPEERHENAMVRMRKERLEKKAAEADDLRRELKRTRLALENEQASHSVTKSSIRQTRKPSMTYSTKRKLKNFLGWTVAVAGLASMTWGTIQTKWYEHLMPEDDPNITIFEDDSIQLNADYSDLEDVLEDVDTSVVMKKGVYHIDFDMEIAEEGFLIIESGTELRFAEGYGLKVYGKLRAEGTEAEKIIFTSTNKREKEGHIAPDRGEIWKGITIEGKHSDKTILDHCEISQAGPTEEVELTGDYYKYGDFRPGGGILINNSRAQIKNCRVYDNWADLGGGIAIINGQGNTVEDTIIEKNIAREDAGGIFIYKGQVNLKLNRIRNNTSDHGAGVIIDDSDLDGGGNVAENNDARYPDTRNGQVCEPGNYGLLKDTETYSKYFI